ncbi:hypothetical protein DAETH_48170 (plasmid) [Deinococcus aetherius]|uniref:Uncharacterized protein n=1 Tax=Deinococcus aetherius TaxID=200252 RepID=A0ABM8ALX7_9DEIO|nr:hypothetical protein [Deinococcus aetherius]BDP44848.1 hypothetical protein DAETH_48170 [Deinococcus aetherius]
MTVRVTLDFGTLDARADQALKATTARVGERTQALLRARVWTWPNVTERRNGELAGLTRNIIDEGTLAASQSEPRRMGTLNYRLTWDADHAAAVFLGAVFRKRAGSLPARNAPLAAIRSLNLPEEFAKAWRKG